MKATFDIPIALELCERCLVNGARWSVVSSVTKAFETLCGVCLLEALFR